MTQAEYPEPIHKAFNREFWKGVKNEELLIQECSECSHHPYPFRLKCPKCFSSLDWIESDGVGKVYSFGIVRRPNQPEVFGDDTPIVVAVITLDDGIRIVSNIIECDPGAINIGDKVSVVFREVDEGIILPKFRLD